MATAMSTKKHHILKNWASVVLLVLSSMIGCAVSARQGPIIDWVVPGGHQVACSAAEFKDVRAVRVRYEDIWQTEEYALYKTADSQLEVIYAKVNKAFTVSLDYQMSIAAMVSTWNQNADQSIRWESAGRLDNQVGTWFYRTYTQSDIQRSCVGFFVEWDEIYEDPRVHPGKILFGYYCSGKEENLADPNVRALIGRIGIQAHNEESASGGAAPDKSENPPPRHRPKSGLENPSALAAARGDGPAATSGNPGFPFRFARYYSESGGGKYN